MCNRRSVFICILSVGVLSVFGLFGCTGKKLADGPQQVLSQYVSATFGLKQYSERSKLLEFTVGPARQALEQMKEDVFKEQFLDTRRNFIALKIKDERPLGDYRYSITYEVSYKSSSPNSDDLVTIKKSATFLKENGKWAISEVQNLKTNIEHQNAPAL